MKKAKTVSASIWKHVQCWKCEKWWAVEDDHSRKYHCPHCGKKNKVMKKKPK